MASFTVFQTQSYPAGTQTSAAVSYSGVGTIAEFAIESSTWATDDPSIVWTLSVQQSFDQGATWEPSEAQPNNGQIFGFTCSPKALVNKQGQAETPSGEFQVEDTLGLRLVRAQVTTTGTLTWGLTGSTTAA